MGGAAPLGDMACIVAESSMADLGLDPPVKGRQSRSRSRGGRGSASRSPGAGRRPTPTNSKSPSKNTRSSGQTEVAPKGILKQKSPVKPKPVESNEAVSESQASPVGGETESAPIVIQGGQSDVEITDDRGQRRNTKDSSSREEYPEKELEDMDQS